jgi:hypothetical protein
MKIQNAKSAQKNQKRKFAILASNDFASKNIRAIVTIARVLPASKPQTNVFALSAKEKFPRINGKTTILYLDVRKARSLPEYAFHAAILSTRQ